MRPLDTSPAAWAAQMALLRRLSGAQRLQLGMQMSDGGREIVRSGIRHRHPEYSTDEIEHALRRLMLGDELFQRAWPDVPLLPA
jgi:hypothetical protein